MRRQVLAPQSCAFRTTAAAQASARYLPTSPRPRLHGCQQHPRFGEDVVGASANPVSSQPFLYPKITNFELLAVSFTQRMTNLQPFMPRLNVQLVQVVFDGSVHDNASIHAQD